MKLSEAIRIGAAKRPQCFDHWFDYTGAGYGSCAFGAAYEALTGDIEEENSIYYRLEQEWPVISEASAWNDDDLSVFDTIARLNDAEHWTREQIADWLEGQGL